MWTDPEESPPLGRKTNVIPEEPSGMFQNLTKEACGSITIFNGVRYALSMNYTFLCPGSRWEWKEDARSTRPIWRGTGTRSCGEDYGLHKKRIGINEQEWIATMTAESITSGKTEDAASSGRVADQGRRRRKYSAEYKLGVLAMAETLAVKGGGELGAFLRKEGLYGSHLSQWRKQKARGLLEERKRGRSGLDRDVLAKEMLRLRRRLSAAEKRAAQSEYLVELQKKSSGMIHWSPGPPCPRPGPP